MTSKPKIEYSYRNLVFLPLEPLVWYIFVLTLFVSFLLDKILKKFDDKSPLFWTTVLILFGQPSNHCVRPPPSRTLNILYMSFNICLFIFCTAYGSCLYSIITIPPSFDAIDTFEKLIIAIKRGRVVINTVRNSYYLEQIRVIFYKIICFINFNFIIYS